MNRSKKFVSLMLPIIMVVTSGYGQEIGSNFNHNPEIIEFEYLEKAKTQWIRTTPYVFEYINKERNIENEEGLRLLVEAGKRGYNLAFGFRWDFKKNNVRVPKPNSTRESEYFETAKELLAVVAPYVKILKLGNEPLLETLEEDMARNSDGSIPIVDFTERLLDRVIIPYYESNQEIEKPEIYVGSMYAIFSEKEQKIDASNELITLANEKDIITGLAIHLHIKDIEDIKKAFNHVRGIMRDKPIIVPEFSLNFIYMHHFNEKIGVNEKGKRFSKRYNRNPSWKFHQWLTEANTNRVSQMEWNDFFKTRDWYPQNFLTIFYDAFKENGVRFASYPLLQQYCPENVTSDSMAWFINPIFCQNSLELNSEAKYSANPLNFDDFVELVERGKKNRPKTIR